MNFTSRPALMLRFANSSSLQANPITQCFLSNPKVLQQARSVAATSAVGEAEIKTK
jgi:hypothetical protein